MRSIASVGRCNCGGEAAAVGVAAFVYSCSDLENFYNMTDFLVYILCVL